MFNLNINTTLRDYIDSVRIEYSRAKYIIQCLQYIRTNNINIYDHYEVIRDDDRISKDDKERKDINKHTV